MTAADAILPDLAISDDVFLGGALRLLQPRLGYRAGVDAVLLAAAVAARPGETCLDVGAGVGTAGLCLAQRIGGAHVVLLEREPPLAALAVENAARNGLDGRVRIVTAEVGATAADLSAAGLRPESFDHVLANPPFHTDGEGTPAPAGLKAGAHAMPSGGLDQWARFMARMTRPGGTATLVHKAEALAEVLAAVEGRFGSIKVLPIQARQGEPAIRVLVQGVKGSRAPLTLLSAFVLHGEGQAFTPAAEAILRHGRGLDLR